MASSVLVVEIPPERVDSARLTALYSGMGVGDVIYDHYALQILIGVASGQYPVKDDSAVRTARSLLQAGINNVTASF